MINKVLLILAVIFFLGAIVEWFIAGMPGSSLVIAEVAALALMLINGTFMKWRRSKVVYVVTFAIVLGVAMKILHLPAADQVLLGSLLTMLVLYSIHFYRKEHKGALDILKLLTFLSYIVISQLSLYRFISGHESLPLIPHIIFWLTFSFFIITGVRKRELFA